MNRFCLLLALPALLFTGSCRKPPSQDVEHAFSTESRSEFGFQGINAGGALDLIVTVGERFSISVEGKTDLLKEVRTEVNDGILVIKSSNKVDSSNKPRLKISMPELRSLEIWGTSTVSVTNIDSVSLRVQVGGSSTASIGGKTEKIEVGATGSSEIEGVKMLCVRAVVQASGASKVTLSVSEELDAEALGASNVIYVGKPKSIKRNIVGAGEIREL
ncbi:MAG: DUF2807 domain-containing protein [Acidobacteria bacterium]|nr:DUF2807 domain-containing protein [Acidobacteriota bacterium]